MTHFNPYTQAWSTGVGSSSEPSFPTLAPPVSMASIPDFVTFHLTSYNPNILNCTIYAPHSRPFLQVATSQRVTTVTDHAEARIATIEWVANPIVEIANSVPRLYVGSWLKISPDRLYRCMAYGDNKYKWMPSGPYVYLYNMTADSPHITAKLSRAADAVSVGITIDAMHVPGLANVILVAALLLQSGQNID